MMNRRRLITLLLTLACGFVGASHQIVPAAQKAAEPGPVVIPFELVTRHILIRVRINNSASLWFIFDTGDQVAIVDLGRTKSLGLNLRGETNVGGAGAGTLKGSYVRDDSIKVQSPTRLWSQSNYPGAECQL
jgi:Aspartyl protease